MLANACSKLAGDKRCKQLLVKIAGHLLNAAQGGGSKRCLIQLADFKLKELVMLANACSKLAGDKHCGQLLVKIADHLLTTSELADNTSSLFEPHHVAILANAYNKVEKGKDQSQSCQQLLVKIAGHVLNASQQTPAQPSSSQVRKNKRQSIEWADFTARQLAMMTTTCNKYRKEANSQQLVIKVAASLLNPSAWTEDKSSAEINKNKRKPIEWADFTSNGCLHWLILSVSSVGRPSILKRLLCCGSYSSDQPALT